MLGVLRNQAWPQRWHCSYFGIGSFFSGISSDKTLVMLPTILRSGILSSPYRQLYCLHFQPLRTAPNFSTAIHRESEVSACALVPFRAKLSGSFDRSPRALKRGPLNNIRAPFAHLLILAAKPISVTCLDGKIVHRTRRKAKELCAKGSHRWHDDFTLIELKPHSSHPDYARLLLSRQLSASVPAYIPTEYIPAKMPALNVPNTRFEQPNSAAWRLCHWDYGPFLPVEIGGNRLE